MFILTSVDENVIPLSGVLKGLFIIKDYDTPPSSLLDPTRVQLC